MNLYGDPGAAIAEADYQPRALRPNPETELAVLFKKMGRDFGGPISPLDVLAWRLMLGQQSEA
jgi:hypothetical protein